MLLLLIFAVKKTSNFINMRKQLVFTLLLGVMCLTAAPAKKNLKLHYDFSVANGQVQDVSGNGYHASLKNDAYTDELGAYRIFNTGYSNGYLDMGAQVGNLIHSLNDFTVAVYVCADAGSSLSANGNFVWTFANSRDVLKEQNGAMFLSAKTQGYVITNSDYKAEKGFSLSKPMKTGEWQHLVYTQKGNTGSLYINSELVKSETVDLLPSSLGATSHNFLARSPYLADTYLRALMTDFRVYNKALTTNEIKTLISHLPSLNSAYREYLQKPVRFVAKGNPLFTHKFTADPAALVHNDTFYIYSGQDTGDGSRYNMPNWLVFSSTDLETWYEHPVPLRNTDFKWATGNNAWAAQVIERHGKFYWYITTEHATKRGKGLGVAVSDSPTGPFKDARGSALVTNDMTTKWTGISWDDIDPTVYIDDDGQAYLFWGNTQCYYARLKDNMIELDSEIIPVDLPAFTEAPWIHKHGDWYYLSYATGFPEKIAYAMSKSLNGPWEYKGILNEIAGNSNTNHQAIVEFKGNWYFVYHNGGINPNGGSYHRSVCIDRLYYNPDGTLKRVQMTTEGPGKVN